MRKRFAVCAATLILAAATTASAQTRSDVEQRPTAPGAQPSQGMPHEMHGQATQPTQRGTQTGQTGMQQQGTQSTQRATQTGETGTERQTTQSQQAATQQLETVSLDDLNQEQAMEIQRKLQELGYYKGEVDGIIGPLTRGALQRYFRDIAALAMRGELAQEALSDFGIESTEVQRVRGEESEEIERQPGSTRSFEGETAPRPSEPSATPRKTPRSAPAPQY
jgi:hypothetical protein